MQNEREIIKDNKLKEVNGGCCHFGYMEPEDQSAGILEELNIGESLNKDLLN